MQFTVVFPAPHTIDLTYGLVFMPGPCWVRSGPDPRGDRARTVVNMARRPDYQPGGVQLLLEAVPALADLHARADSERNVVIVAHATGHGTANDLLTLQDDLRGNGYRSITVRL